MCVCVRSKGPASNSLDSCYWRRMFAGKQGSKHSWTKPMPLLGPRWGSRTPGARVAWRWLRTLSKRNCRAQFVCCWCFLSWLAQSVLQSFLDKSRYKSTLTLSITRLLQFVHWLIRWLLDRTRVQQTAMVENDLGLEPGLHPFCASIATKKQR